MAYKPSMRRSGVGLELELDIKPVMNLMVVLIPLLLAGVEYIKLSIIEIDLPPTQAGAGAGEGEQNPEQEREQRLGLKIAITRDGFTIATASAMMSDESGEGPTVPLNAENDFDYDTLKENVLWILPGVVNTPNNHLSLPASTINISITKGRMFRITVYTP